jgi:NAD-dependent SIR2 family protein deacetylase
MTSAWSELRIRKNMRRCRCLSCEKQYPKDDYMFHANKDGSRWSMCLDCIEKLGQKAKILKEGL